MMTSRSLICLLENQNGGKLQKINFGNLGNSVTVGDTFISWLTFKVKF
jgi:hypothetical protein